VGDGLGSPHAQAAVGLLDPHVAEAEFVSHVVLDLEIGFLAQAKLRAGLAQVLDHGGGFLPGGFAFGDGRLRQHREAGKQSDGINYD